jgi:hypothetical protein
MIPLYNKDGKHWNNGFAMYCEHCKEERHMFDRQRVVIFEVSKADSAYYGEEVGHYNTYEICNDCIKDYLKKNPAAELAPKDNFDTWLIANNPKPSFSKVGIMRKINKHIRSMKSAGAFGEYSTALLFEGKAEGLIDLLEESFLPQVLDSKEKLNLEERFNRLEKAIM